MSGHAAIQAAAARCWLSTIPGGECSPALLSFTLLELTSVRLQREGFVIHSLGDLREAIYGAEPMQAVIIDVDFNLSAAKLMRAQVQLQNENCLFLAGAADALIPFGKGDIIGIDPSDLCICSLLLSFTSLRSRCLYRCCRTGQWTGSHRAGQAG